MTNEQKAIIKQAFLDHFIEMHNSNIYYEMKDYLNDYISMDAEHNKDLSFYDNEMYSEALDTLCSIDDELVWMKTGTQDHSFLANI